MDDIKLIDLIDAATLQRIQDAFANATGMAALTVDLDGAVTNLSNPTEFCMKLTRGCPKGAERCNQCDLKGGNEAARTGRPSVYYCHGGLMDFAAPIFLGNRQIGSMIGGQVLPQPPDESKFRGIARELGIQENVYLRALSQVPIVQKKTIEASAQLLFIMANTLSDMGLQRYKTRQLTTELKQASVEMKNQAKQAQDRIQKVEQQNRVLYETVESLSGSTKKSKAEVEKTNQIVKYTNDVSMQTKLLGFNASVEASRAKEYGAGFNVIAQEIRQLADSTQKQYGQIGDIMGAVRGTIQSIEVGIEKARAQAQENHQMLEGAIADIGAVNETAKRLDELGRKL